MKIQYFLGAVAVLVVASPRLASAQTTAFANPDTPKSVGSVQETSFFSDLDGMTVTWHSTSGACLTGCSGTWEQIGSSPIWGVVDPAHNFSLTAFGALDTYGILDPYVWNLSAKNLSEFALDPMSATNGGAVFDIVNSPEETPGSDVGRPFKTCPTIFCLNSDDNWNTTATYSSQISIGSAVPAGDLWGGLDVTFGKTFGKNRSQTITFSSDVDLVEGGFSTPQDVTPEPAEMTLLATGLVGLAGFTRRRRRNS